MLTRDSAPFGELVRIEGIAAELRRAGHAVDLLVMDRRRALRALGPSFAFYAAAKLLLLSRRLGRPSSWPMLKIWINCVLNAFVLAPRIRAGGYNILLAETHYSGLCGWLMRPHVDARLYVDFHGTAEEIAARPAFYAQGIALERLLVRECDFAISCSGAMRRHLVELHGGDAARHIVCHNGTEPRARVAAFRLPMRVVYAGLFAYFQRVTDFVEAARLNEDPEIEFVLMGGGENEAEVLRHIAEQRIPIKWLGYKPRAETLDFFADMQIGVMPATNDVARRVASPLKILDYAACGLPVVTVAVGEWSEIFHIYKAGVVCERSDGATLLAAIRSLKNEALWRTASENAQRLVREQRSWPAVLAPLLDHLGRFEADHQDRYESGSKLTKRSP